LKDLAVVRWLGVYFNKKDGFPDAYVSEREIKMLVKIRRTIKASGAIDNEILGHIDSCLTHMKTPILVNSKTNFWLGYLSVIEDMMLAFEGILWI
jgi:hypothetical protein